MTAPLKLRLSKRELHHAILLARGDIQWEHLDYEDKVALYETGVDLTDTVEPEKVNELERRIEAGEGKGLPSIGRSVIRAARRRIPI